MRLGRLGLSDIQVLLHAADSRPTLITHNNKDFRLLQEAWAAWRRRWEDEAARAAGGSISLSRHAGIAIVPLLPVQDLVSILSALAESADSLSDRLVAWSPRRGWRELRFELAN
jgi:hypothetical protein